MVQAARQGNRTSAEDELVVLSGSDFCVSDRRGDVEPHGEPNGFFVRDMRHLSTWRLLVQGGPTRLLSSRNIGHDSARFFLTLGWARVGHDSSVSIIRQRRVGQWLEEELALENHSGEPVRLRLELQYGCDFADVFEVKDPRPKRGTVHVETRPGGAALRYDRDGFWRSTEVAFDPPPDSVTEWAASFELELAPRGRWCLRVAVTCAGDGIRPAAAGVEPAASGRDAASPAHPPLEPPRLGTDRDGLGLTYRQALSDLAALRFRPFAGHPWAPPAAGLPWFMALFGRDSLITSYQALPFDPSLAAATLESLAALQAAAFDDFRDAEPGKIPHELRVGELVRFDEMPHGPYYGTHDATPLFLVLLDEYERWTGDAALVRRLERPARAALEWMERFGDLDGDGYLEYRTRSPRGLVNQCWKDSWNSMLFAGGDVAEPPVATCEIQGYAYDAFRRSARLARLVWRDRPLAERLERRAAELRRRFRDDFWSESRGHYVLALDGAGRQVDSMTSNVGHLLWSGILDEDRAAESARRLLRGDMDSGWGIRTMSTADGGYNPMSYHDGTVWPHDTGIVAEGLRRYGFRAEATGIVAGMIEAAECFERHRLPEAFAGFGRSENPFPVEYPTASRPQGWSAGAPLLALRTLLGLDVVNGRLRVDPCLPPTIGTIELSGLHVRGARAEATAAGWGGPGRRASRPAGRQGRACARSTAAR